MTHIICLICTYTSRHALLRCEVDLVARRNVMYGDTLAWKDVRVIRAVKVLFGRQWDSPLPPPFRPALVGSSFAAYFRRTVCMDTHPGLWHSVFYLESDAVKLKVMASFSPVLY